MSSGLFASIAMVTAMMMPNPVMGTGFRVALLAAVPGAPGLASALRRKILRAAFLPQISAGHKYRFFMLTSGAAAAWLCRMPAAPPSPFLPLRPPLPHPKSRTELPAGRGARHLEALFLRFRGVQRSLPPFRPYARCRVSPAPLRPHRSCHHGCRCLRNGGAGRQNRSLRFDRILSGALRYGN